MTILHQTTGRIDCMWLEAKDKGKPPPPPPPPPLQHPLTTRPTRLRALLVNNKTSTSSTGHLMGPHFLMPSFSSNFAKASICCMLSRSAGPSSSASSLSRLPVQQHAYQNAVQLCLRWQQGGAMHEAHSVIAYVLFRFSKLALANTSFAILMA